MDQKTSKGIAIFLAAIAMVISDTSWATEKTLKVGGPSSGRLYNR
jgi:hypothetical protein